MTHHTDTVIALIKQDALRLAALKQVYALKLPCGYIAAGFIRNLVWDHLHSKTIRTPLNDVDVIYFDDHETNQQQYIAYERMLQANMPDVNWQVRNQSLMHTRNGDPKYTNIIDAMSYWPEKETAVAIRLLDKGHYECISTFGFESLFQGHITHNPKRQKATFEQRVTTKKWLTHWPTLTPTSLTR